MLFRSFSFDKTVYSAGTYNLTVNISTNDNNSLQLHDSLYQQTSTFTIYVYSTTLAAVNNRAGVTSYNVGDAGILNMSIKRNDTLFDPQGITVTIKDSADPCTVAGSPLFTHTYPGDIQKTATGVYYSKTIFTATGQVHWCVYVSDVNANVSTASHSDRDVNSASGTINITIADNDSTTSNTTVILYDFNQYDLNNATLNLTNSSLVHSVTANSNYHTDINTSDGCKLYLQRFNSSSANPLILIQFANTTIPSNLKLLSSVIAVNGSAFNFSSANLTIPKNNLRIDYILHCTDWNFGTATCNSWQRNVTSDYSNYGSNSTHFWFSVTSFTGYAGGEGYNSNLTIYDDSDSETVYANNSIIFYANYSNSTTGISIDNATTECNISFNITPNGPYQMTYDASSGLWEYNRTVVSKGNYSWNVSCVNTAGYDNLTAEDNVTVQNSQPVFTPVSILPATAYTNDTLNATTTYTDTDNDAGNVTFVWFLNNSNIYNTTFLNVANNTILTSNLSGTNFSHFDLVNVTVYAFDGTNYSQNFTSTNTINISNTIPVVTTPSLLPTTVYKTNNLNATTTYTDLDLDSGSLLFMWYVNNVNLFNQTITNVANNTIMTSNLSGTNFSHFDLVNVTVYAFD